MDVFQKFTAYAAKSSPARQHYQMFMQIIAEGELLSYRFPPHSNRTHLSLCYPGIALGVLSTPNYVNMCMQDRFIAVLFALNRLFSVALSYKKNNYYITNNQFFFVISSTQIKIHNG